MKILVIDDHVLIREALQALLKKLKRGAVVLEASDSRQAMEIFAVNADIGLVMLDLNLPDRDGLSVLAELREHHPAVAVVVMSAIQERATVMQALDLGAVGYIPKSARREVMMSALQLIFAGGIYIPPEVLAHGESSAAAASPQPNERLRPNERLIVSPSEVGLSERQLDVLAHLMQGKNNKVICRVLGLAEPTVKNHVTAILRALKVSNRTEAVIAVNELGWKLPANPKS
jgi:DNA-binding NarL/FixJ family response regulator